jgi:hypothetical protein
MTFVAGYQPKFAFQNFHGYAAEFLGNLIYTLKKGSLALI